MEILRNYNRESLKYNNNKCIQHPTRTLSIRSHFGNLCLDLITELLGYDARVDLDTLGRVANNKGSLFGCHLFYEVVFEWVGVSY